MKKFYFSILGITVATLMSAQYSITATNMPAVGDVHNFYDIDTSSVAGQGSAGSAQTWNFSAITELLPMGGSNYVAVGTTPDGASYPTSTVAQNDSSKQYTFFSGGTSNIVMDGLVLVGTATVTLSDKGTMINAFPFGFGASSADSLSGTVSTSAAGNGTVNGSITTTADGSGTLILPGGTFSNVLRVRSYVNLNLVLGGGLLIITQREIRYSWYNTASKFPLFETGHNITVGQTDTRFATMNSVGFDVGIKENKNNSSFNLFPNPAKNELNVNMNITTQKSFSIEIINQLGQVVKSENYENLSSGAVTKKIDITGISSGIYYARLKNSDFNKVQKFIVE